MSLATEVSRDFDVSTGAVVVYIQDEFGNVSPNTIYPGVDVNTAVAQIIVQTDINTAVIKAHLQAAGWQG